MHFLQNKIQMTKNKGISLLNTDEYEYARIQQFQRKKE